MDVKIKNGDILTDAAGNPLYTEDGIEDICQQVLICITAQKGGFVDNKELGIHRGFDVSTPRGIKCLESQLRRAVADIEGAEIFVKGTEELEDGRKKVQINLQYDSQIKVLEVIL